MATELQQRSLEVGSQASAHWVYMAARGVVTGLLQPFLGVDVRGREHIPRNGRVLLAPVHRSNLDAPLVGAAARRRVRALAKESLFKNAAFGWIISAIGAFPIKRGEADRDSLAAAQTILENEEALLVFPEGSRQSGQQVGEMFRGTGYLAAKTQTAIVPIGIAGTEDALGSGSKMIKRTPVVMVIDPPMQPPPLTEKGRVDRMAVRAFTEELAGRMQAVMDEAHTIRAARL